MKLFIISSFFIINFILVSSIKVNKLLQSLNAQNIILSLLSFENLNYNREEEQKEKENLRGELFKILREIVEKRNLSAANITKSCENVINRYLLGHIYDSNISSPNISYIISDYNIIKLLDDSSKNRNNLGTYDQCMHKTYKFWNKLENISPEIYNISSLETHTYSTYVVLSKDNNGINDNDINLLELDFNYSLQGYCFPQGYKNNGEYCTDNDYRNILLYYNKEFHDLFQFNNSRIEVFTLREKPADSEKTSTILKIVNLLPFIYFLFQALLCIIIMIFNLYKKNKENNTEKTKENRDETFDVGRISDFGNKTILNTENKNLNDKKRKFLEFLGCFDLLENAKELFNFSINSTEYNNDSGLNYIRGLIGFSTLFIVVGFTFIVAYNSPTKVSSPNQLSDFFKNNWLFYSIIMTGIRYSPRIIISCSGYLLAFKYVSYLDKNYIRNLDPLFKLTLKFLSFQIHKFILLILLILFERCSTFELYDAAYKTQSPIFKYFTINILKKPNWLRFFISFTLFGYFVQYNDEQYRNRHHLLMYFWMPFNEIIFFLIGIFIIFFGFKFKMKIDIFILCLVPLLYIGKILYSYLIVDYKNGFDEELEFPVQKCYSTLFYVFFNYGRDMINPLFNLSYYLIGMYFGLVNYTIQKGINKVYKSNKVKSFITKEEMEGLLIKKENENSDISSSNSDENDEIIVDKLNENEPNQELELRDEIIKMPFLKLPVKFVIWHRQQNKNFLIVIPIILIVLFFFFISSIAIFNEVYESINEVFRNFTINLIYRIDIELVIFFFQWSFFYLIQIKNISLDFLSNILWITLSRPYFSFILVINTVLLFIFYHDETLIEINSVSILMYSLIGAWFTFLVMSLFYILYELPLKRVTRLFYVWESDLNDKELDNKIEKDNLDDSENDEDNNNIGNINKIKNE